MNVTICFTLIAGPNDSFFEVLDAKIGRSSWSLKSHSPLILRRKSRHSVTFTFISVEAKTLTLIFDPFWNRNCFPKLCLSVWNESRRCSLYWELFTRCNTVFWYSADIYALFAFLRRGGWKRIIWRIFLSKIIQKHLSERIFFPWRCGSSLSCCYATVEDFNILWRWLVLLRSVGKQIWSSAAYQCVRHTTHCSMSPKR